MSLCLSCWLWKLGLHLLELCWKLHTALSLCIIRWAAACRENWSGKLVVKKKKPPAKNFYDVHLKALRLMLSSITDRQCAKACLLDERHLSEFCCDCWIAYSKADSSIALISSSEKFTYVSADELFVCT